MLKWSSETYLGGVEYWREDDIDEDKVKKIVLNSTLRVLFSCNSTLDPDQTARGGEDSEEWGLSAVTRRKKCKYFPRQQQPALRAASLPCPDNMLGIILASRHGDAFQDRHMVLIGNCFIMCKMSILVYWLCFSDNVILRISLSRRGGRRSVGAGKVVWLRSRCLVMSTDVGLVTSCQPSRLKFKHNKYIYLSISNFSHKNIFAAVVTVGPPEPSCTTARHQASVLVLEDRPGWQLWCGAV